jgi:DNA-directed RNA polymerase subunit RPC12/RpoP
VTTRKLELACPVCGSAGVFYSCTPNCCFNHVCGDCGATFEPATILQGSGGGKPSPPDPLPEASDPTAPCVRCDSTAVYMADDGGVVCGSCGARLAIEYTEVSPS